MKKLEDYVGAKTYGINFICNSKNAKDIELFEKIWPTILSMLVKIFSEKSVLEIYTGGVTYNVLQDYYHAGIGLTFAKDDYSEKEARYDISKVLATFSKKKSELMIANELQIDIHVGDFDESEVRTVLKS